MYRQGMYETFYSYSMVQLVEVVGLVYSLRWALDLCFNNIIVERDNLHLMTTLREWCVG